MLACVMYMNFYRTAADCAVFNRVVIALAGVNQSTDGFAAIGAIVRGLDELLVHLQLSGKKA